CTSTAASFCWQAGIPLDAGPGGGWRAPGWRCSAHSVGPGGAGVRLWARRPAAGHHPRPSGVDRPAGRGGAGRRSGGFGLSSVAVARAGDRIGRRRMYLILCLLLGASGVIFAYATSWWLFTVAALTGTVSTEVIASGPLASLDQAMLAGEPDRARRLGAFGRYNAV
ncbi:hypothetical protein B2A_03865, partial [mine drainage metagenome]